jgi:hypothetical protein
MRVVQPGHGTLRAHPGVRGGGSRGGARAGRGGSVGLGDAAGGGYCWRCGDDGHAKSACPRRGEGGGGSRASGGGGYGTQVAGDGRDVSGGGGGKSGAAAAAAADDISDHIRGLSVG